LFRNKDRAHLTLKDCYHGVAKLLKEKGVLSLLIDKCIEGANRDEMSISLIVLLFCRWLKWILDSLYLLFDYAALDVVPIIYAYQNWEKNFK